MSDERKLVSPEHLALLTETTQLAQRLVPLVNECSATFKMPEDMPSILVAMYNDSRHRFAKDELGERECLLAAYGYMMLAELKPKAPNAGA